LSAVAGAQTKPPTAPVRPVTDDYFGTKLVDPYRWMENSKSAEFQTWLKQQADYTQAVLAKIPSRSQLAARLQSLSNAATTVAGAQRVNGRYFYSKTLPTDNNRKVYVRMGDQERILIDPEKISTKEKHYSIDWFYPDDAGKLVAYGISQGGSEDSVLHIIDSDSGRELGEQIDRARFGVVSWFPDGKSFFYNRQQKLAPGAPPAAAYLNSRTYIHRVGSSAETDIPVFGRNLSPTIEIAEPDFPFLIITPGNPAVLGVVAHGVQREATIYAASLSVFSTGSPDASKISWRKIADVNDDVTGAAVHGDQVYLLTHHDASRFKVVRTSISAPNPAEAAVVVPAGEGVLQDIQPARDALYVKVLDGGIGRLLRVPYEDGAKPKAVALPFEGSLPELSTNPQEDGALVLMASWTKSPVVAEYSPETGAVNDTKIAPPSEVDFSGIEVREVKAKALDGTLVPLSILYKRGMRLDGSNPALLMGYGAYGITMDPSFAPTRLAWLERGGVYAVAHVRGGGEYGEDWHKGGQKLTKQNTIGDFLACADYLIEQGYSSRKKLSGQGGSAGGITIGGAITQQPQMFAAALINVGDNDALRSETMPSGPANIPEFGTVKTEEGFRALYAMDAYQHVKDGTPYPAVLLTTGSNDPRVEPWQAAKMTARLQTASSSGKPVLLRVDYDAGHGIGSTKSQRIAELADEYSFLFWQLGLPEFAIADH
ncbi:MAG: S9 family peptidase, partial [Acidobacteriaceae bacterium]|nr:S9 family peptidase [Acidobacteriaceae bacterium]